MARLVALLIMVSLLAGCGSSSHAAAAKRRQGTLQTIFEDEGRLHADPAGTLSLLVHLGVSRVRVFVPWQSLAPAATSRRAPANFTATDPAAYPAVAWAIYDRIVREAAQRRIGVDLTVGAPVPAWALGHGAPRSPYFSWRPSARAFGAFMRALGTRYSGHYKPAGATAPLPAVNFWSIWNEPNYGPYLAPQAIDRSTVEVSPMLYRALLDAAWSALQGTGHGADTVLIGETAPRGITTGDNPGNFSGMVPLRFIRALYCVGADFRPLSGIAASMRGCPAGAPGSAAFPRQHPALFRAGGFADHPYSQGGLPPNQVAPYEPDYADLASLPKLEQTLDRAQSAYGSYPRLPIYSTEFGYQTNPPENIQRTTSPGLAARYLNWAEYLSWRDPRVRSYDQFLLTDPPSGNFATGLLFSDGRPKPSYEAFRLPIFLPAPSRSGGRVEVWGCVRPVQHVPLNSASPVRIQYRPAASSAFKTVETVTVTDPRGYFDVSVSVGHSGQLRLAWAYPHGATIHSRTAALGSG